MRAHNRRPKTGDGSIDGGGYDGLLMNDAVTPAQWASLHTPNPNLTSERKLLLAMLIDALRIYKRGKPERNKYQARTDTRNVLLWEDAVAWLTDLDSDGITSLRGVCAALEHRDYYVAPEAIAAHVKAGRPIAFVYRPYTSGVMRGNSINPAGRRGRESRVTYRERDFVQ